MSSIKWGGQAYCRHEQRDTHRFGDAPHLVGGFEALQLMLRTGKARQPGTQPGYAKKMT